ncbi:MAG: cache domain-containing protein, partial [Patescibacteria group bacterium]|nr:cache domain-containing protein [Patescibacteria group bacterium]
MNINAIRSNGRKLRARAPAFATTVALLVAASVFTWWAAWRANRELCVNFLRQVRPIARAVNADRIRTLSGSLADREHADYRRLKDQLDAVCSADPTYRYAYLLGRKPEGAIFFFVGTGWGDEAEPGEVYQDAPEAMRRVFDTGMPETVGPYADRWGSFVSGIVPIIDPLSGVVIAVLGVDIDARDWRWEVAADTALPVGLMLVLAVMLMAGIRAARGPAAGAPKPIRRRLLAPLAVVFVLLVAGFGFALANLHQRHLSRVSTDLLNRAAGELREQTALQADALAAMHAVILRDDALRSALKDADRQRLLAAWGPAFQQLRDKHAITHLYFLDPSRTCFLRVHKPEKHGDLVDRATALKAERTGAIASGVELGPLGTFTLRVVCPVFDGGELIGYIELGKEIEDGLAHVRAAHGVDMVVDIRKSVLNRGRWEAGMKMLGRDANWNRFPDDVVIYSSLSPIPNELGQLIEHRGWLRETGDKPLAFGGRMWHVHVSPLRDASGQLVGDLLVLNDVTEPILAFRRMTLLAAGSAIVLLVVLHGVVHILLRRTDADILAQQTALCESEEKYRELVENASATICSVTREGVLRYVSPNWTHLLGHEIAEVAGTVYAEFVHPGDAPLWNEVLRDVFDSGRERTGIECRMRNAEGRWFWHAASVSPVRDPAGQTASCIVVSRDITHRKTA